MRSLIFLFGLITVCTARGNDFDETYPEIMLSDERIQLEIRNEAAFSEQALQLGKDETEGSLTALLTKQIEQDVDKQISPSLAEQIRKEVTERVKPVKIGDKISFYNKRSCRTFSGILKSVKGDYAVIGYRDVFLPDNPELALRIKPALLEKEIEKEIKWRYANPRKILYQRLWDERCKAFYHKYAFVYNQASGQWEYVLDYYKNRHQQVLSDARLYREKVEHIQEITEQLELLNDNIDSLNSSQADAKQKLENYDDIRKIHFYVIAKLERNKYEVKVSSEHAILETTEVALFPGKNVELWCSITGKMTVRTVKGKIEDWSVFREATSYRLSLYLSALRDYETCSDAVKSTHLKITKLRNILREEREKAEALKNELLKFQE